VSKIKQVTSGLKNMSLQWCEMAALGFVTPQRRQLASAGESGAAEGRQLQGWQH